MAQSPLNPFQPPQADIEHRPSTGSSLQDALEGRYDFQIGDVMNEAWALTKGFKASFWAAAVLIYLAFGVLLVVSTAIMEAAFGEDNVVASLIVNIGSSALLTPLTMGLVMLAVRRAQGQPVRFTIAFSFLDKATVAIVAGFLVALLTYLGLFLLVLPGLYLGVAYGMALPLIADRDLGAWPAMETSRKALTHKWFRLFGLYLLVGLLVGLSALPLLIPLIWTGPWSMLVMGVVYKRIFGTPELTSSAR